jgi:hypothetical protein
MVNAGTGLRQHASLLEVGKISFPFPSCAYSAARVKRQQDEDAVAHTKDQKTHKATNCVPRGLLGRILKRQFLPRLTTTLCLTKTASVITFVQL